MKLYAHVLIFALLVSGCYDDFDMPDVISATPERNQIAVGLDTQVVVTFSKKMDTMKTSNEFSLSSSTGSVRGYFSWSNGDTVLNFRPAEPLGRAEKYTIRVTEDAEDSKGNDLDEEFVSSFYTGGDNTKPVVESFSPAADSIGNANNTVVAIVFSEPMDPDTVYDGFIISPAAEGYYEWNADHTVAMFRPVYGFNYGVTYTATVNTSIKDSAGNSLDKEMNFNFTVGDDFTPPEFTVYQDNPVPLYLDENDLVGGAEKDGSIIIDFSEVVNIDRIAGAVSISPAARFFISTSTVASSTGNITRAVLNFTENLSSEETYTLRIGSSITDLQDNSLAGEYRFVFITNGFYSVTPAVRSIGDPVITGWPMNDIVILALPVDASGNAVKLYDGITIDFTRLIDPLSLEITVDMVAGSSGSPSVVNIDWPVVAPAGEFSRLTFGLYDISPGKTYSIRIKGGAGGLKDQYGNFMKGDFVQMVKFTQ